MRAGEFAELARAGIRDYGDDPWCFLRELAQNGRDAGAGRIDVQTFHRPAAAGGMEEGLIFSDDGAGMGQAYARRYLFRLYASEKGEDPLAAGKYGIGFWAVLKFAPQRLEIHSCTGRENWAVSCADDLTPTPVPSHRRERGTSVVLVRPAQFPDGESLRAAVAAGLDHYCRHLRRRRGRFRPLPVWLDGRRIDRPLQAAGKMSLYFRTARVEGVVAVGDEPRVELLVRGLPVWRGSLLDELRVTGRRPYGGRPVGSGVAPVFLLNSSELDVTLRRDAVMENRALQRLVHDAEEAQRELLRRFAGRAFGWSGREWLLSGWQRLKRTIGGHTAWRWLLLLVPLVALEVMVLQRIVPMRSGSPPQTAPVRQGEYRGAGVVSAAGSLAELDLRYTPPKPLLLRLESAWRYDAAAGLLPGAGLPEDGLRPVVDGESIELRLRVRQPGPQVLPEPSGFAWDAARGVRGSSGALPMPTRVGETWVLAEAPVGEIAYFCRGAAGTLAPAARMALLEMPPTHLPEEFTVRLASAEIPAPPEAVRRVTAAVTMHMRYDRSPDTIRLYARPDARPWAHRVWSIGRGDCDVLNGLAVLGLRRLGVPARLALGVVGEAGAARPEWHAWAEYFAGSWKTLDVTTERAVVPLASPSTPSLPVPPPPRRPEVPVSFWILAALTSGGALFLLRWLLHRRQHAADPAPVGRAEMVRLAAAALVEPRLWKIGDLLHFPILPTLHGRRISVRRALRLAEQGRLYMAAREKLTAWRVAAGGATVLNGADEEYRPLLRLLPGVCDLDRLVEMLRQPLVSPAEAAVMASFNRLLGAVVPRAPRCLWSGAADTATVVDVDVPRGWDGDGSGAHGRISFFSRHSSAVAEVRALWPRQPREAMFRLLEIWLGGSRRATCAAEARRRAARYLLREWPRHDL